MTENGLSETPARFRGRGVQPQRAVVLALGAGSQLCQVILVRELLMVFHGNELSLGIALAAWLFWGALGSLAGAGIARRSVQPWRMAAAVAVVLLLVTPATILGLRGVRSWFAVAPGELLSFTDVVTAGVPLLAPVCLLWGAQFVLLARLWRDRAATRGIEGAVSTYIAEAAGNMAGGLLFSLLLVHVLDPLTCGALAAACVVAALGGLAPPRSLARRAMLAGGLVAVGAMPWWSRLDAASHVRQWRQKAPDRDLLSVHRSRYGRIAVTRYADQYGFYQSGHLVFSVGADDGRSDPFEDQDGAFLAHLALVQHPDPRRVLLIGGGWRGVLRALLEHPVDAVDVVELDPALTRAASDRLPATAQAARTDPRVRMINADGRLLIKGSDREYDLILLDVPDPVTAALNRYYTLEFFEEARRRLRPGGVLALGVTSTAGLREPAAANRNATVYHTLNRVFDRVLAVGDRVALFFATDAAGRLSADATVIRERYRSRAIDAVGFTDRQFVGLLQPEPVRRLNWVLRHHGRRRGDVVAAPDSGPLFPPSIEEQAATEGALPPPDARYFINTDGRPIAYFHSLMFLDRQTRRRHDALLGTLLRIRPAWLAPVVGLILASILGLRVAGGRRRAQMTARWALRLAVLTTGLSTMTVQIALMFAFQSQYGFVYEMLGLIAALFMGGLACGAAAGARLRATWARLTWMQLLIAGWACILAVGLPAAARLSAPAAMLALYAGMTFVAGLWNGMTFPLALACVAATERHVDRAVGLTYGLESAGAGVGALLAGTAVIPVLGLSAACGFAAVLNATAFGAMIIADGMRAP